MQCHANHYCYLAKVCRFLYSFRIEGLSVSHDQQMYPKQDQKKGGEGGTVSTTTVLQYDVVTSVAIIPTRRDFDCTVPYFAVIPRIVPVLAMMITVVCRSSLSFFRDGRKS
jgi:hypothetical protein